MWQALLILHLLGQADKTLDEKNFGGSRDARTRAHRATFENLNLISESGRSKASIQNAQSMVFRRAGSIRAPIVVGLALSLSVVRADLRLGSQPRKKFRVRNYGGSIPFVTQTIKYMEPQTFSYDGLNARNGQRHNNYDNFLRSNIDNEQDNRNFYSDVGRDHLPFRTREGQVKTMFQVGRWDNTQPFSVNITISVPVGVRQLVPLRWNNPHASELEVNIWLMKTSPLVVVPIRLPTCSGQGYQDNIVEFTIPPDFLELGAKVPGFKGCGNEGDCVLQIYAHSVESRTYALGIPIIIHGHKNELTTVTPRIEAARQDPWFDIGHLRNVCLFNTAATANIPTAIPRYARLTSDVFNHAYQDSDYSPYQGQQFESISKNLQASCLLKGVSGNRGELGKSIMPNGASRLRASLDSRVKSLYKRYEGIANKIITSLGNGMKSTGNIGEQAVNTCFHCAEVGSTNTNRLTTTTYIPSFKLASNLVAAARRMVPRAYSGLITDDGEVQIYLATLNDLMRSFQYAAENYGLTYQPAKLKTTLGTLADETGFLKVTASGARDQGQYAAERAKKAHYVSLNCPEQCFSCGSSQVRYPLFRNSAGTCTKHCFNGLCSDASEGSDCRACARLYSNGRVDIKTTPISEVLANGGSLPSSGAKDVRDMTPAENHGTGSSITDGDIDQSTIGNPDAADQENPSMTNPILRNPDNSGEGTGTGGAPPVGGPGSPPPTGGDSGSDGGSTPGGSSPGLSAGKTSDGMSGGEVAATVLMVLFAVAGMGALAYFYVSKTGPFRPKRDGRGRGHRYSNELQMAPVGMPRRGQQTGPSAAWEARLDDSNHIYYYNTQTGESKFLDEDVENEAGMTGTGTRQKPAVSAATAGLASAIARQDDSDH